MRRNPMIDVIILVLICVVIGSFAQVYIKLGVGEKGGISLSELVTRKIFSILFNRYVFLGLLLYSISTILWFVILSKAELSFVYPLIALGYIVTAFLAKIYFNESLTLLRWSGIVLILIGAGLILKS